MEEIKNGLAVELEQADENPAPKQNKNNKKKNKLKRMTWFDYLNYSFLLICVLLMLYPFYFVLIGSFSEGQDYMGGGVMYGEAAWIGYDGELCNEFKYTTETVVDKNKNYPFVLKMVGTPVTVNTTDVTLSEEKVAFGNSVVTVTPVEGKMITALTAPEGSVVTANQDGTYSVEINNAYAANAESFALNATVDTALAVTATITGNGTVSYNGIEITDTFYVGASAAYTLVVTPAIGHVVTVKVGDTVIEATEAGYVIPVGTTEVSVEFTVLSANLTVTVGENGSATLAGKALANGVVTMEQGKAFALVVTPQKGYAETIMLGDVALVKGENGYEVLLTADVALTITFAKVEYTITYDLDRGENAESNPATYTVDDEVVFADATKEGYVFLGWYVMDGETEVKVNGIEKGSVGNIEVFAKFEVAEVAPEVDEEKDFMDKVTEKFEEVKGEVSDMINGVKEEGFGYLTAGCNGSVSAIGMGVAALAVAFIALKKKED